jgi:hypothetical protein
MEVYGSVWNGSMGVWKYVWKYMEVYGSIWKHMEAYGSIWEYIANTLVMASFSDFLTLRKYKKFGENGRKTHLGYMT